MAPPRPTLGQSLAIDLHHCERALIADVATVKDVMLRAAKESGATVVDAHFHQFAPQGISGVVVITESHFAIHTWPEYEFAAVDVFTCGRSVDLDKATALLTAGFRAQSAAVTHHLERGAAKPTKPAEHVTVLITLLGCQDTSEVATRTFLQVINQLAKAHGNPLFAHAGFALLDEKLSVSGRISEDRVDVSVMAAATVAPPAWAQAATTAFKAASFSFHTGL